MPEEEHQSFQNKVGFTTQHIITPTHFWYWRFRRILYRQLTDQLSPTGAYEVAAAACTDRRPAVRVGVGVRRA